MHVVWGVVHGVEIELRATHLVDFSAWFQLEAQSITVKPYDMDKLQAVYRLISKMMAVLLGAWVVVGCTCMVETVWGVGVEVACVHAKTCVCVCVSSVCCPQHVAFCDLKP